MTAVPRFLALALLAWPAPAQSLAHQKYQLENGMTVILHEDHSLPEACVNLWVGVGSKDEASGRSGFAHLFEHLMFMGTERVPGADFDLLMEAGGGRNNATTSEDRTSYFSSGPAELLPTLLWLEADRLEDLGRTMTQEKLDAQRAIVRNERRQTSENVPYGKAELVAVELLYPEGHPYHHPVIGSHADLEAATLEDVQAFFAAYYVPSNISLVVAGDFDLDATRKLIDELFGTLPRGADAIHRRAGPVALESEIEHTMVDDVQFARTSLIWHTPAAFEPGDAELGLIATILTEGVASRLVRSLVVESESAQEIEARQASSLLGSTFEIDATARPGIALETLESAIDRALADLARDGPSEEELARAKAGWEARLRSRMETIQQRADGLNRYQFHLGEPDSFERDLSRYLDATREGLREWSERVLAQHGRLVLRVLPRTPGPASDPRDTRPTPGLSAPFVPPLPESFSLSNGVQVLFWYRPGAPFVELDALAPFGAACDPLGRAGLAQLAGDMLDEGAGSRDSRAFAEALRALGASLSISVDYESTRVHLATLRRNFHQALLLDADALLRPGFEEHEWKRVHELHRLALEADLDSPATVATRVAHRLLFGDSHPLGRAVDGSSEEVALITLEDALRFQRAAWQPSGTVLLAAGDISLEELRVELEDSFGRWTSEPGWFPVPLLPTAPAAGDLRCVIVDRPGAVQTVVGFLTSAPAWYADERPGWELLSTILGGTFTSRLNQNLREKHGYSYGARSRYTPGREVAGLWASAAVRADVTGASIGEFLAEFRALRGGSVTAAEADKARATWRFQRISEVSRTSSLLDLAADLHILGQPVKALETEQARIAALGAGELNQLAHAFVPWEQGVLVLVGDEATIVPQLEGLGLPAPLRASPSGELLPNR